MTRPCSCTLSCQGAPSLALEGSDRQCILDEDGGPITLLLLAQAVSRAAELTDELAKSDAWAKAERAGRKQAESYSDQLRAQVAELEQSEASYMVRLGRAEAERDLMKTQRDGYIAENDRLAARVADLTIKLSVSRKVRQGYRERVAELEAMLPAPGDDGEFV